MRQNDPQKEDEEEYDRPDPSIRRERCYFV